MPSESKAQHNLMEARAHGAKLKGKGGPSVKVAKEFVAADKAKGPDYVKGLSKKLGLG